MFTLSEAATLSFDALRLLRMSRRGGVEGHSVLGILPSILLFKKPHYPPLN
jgi:hypothetical protein